MPSAARRIRAQKLADSRKQAGDFDPDKAGRSLDLRRTKGAKRSAAGEEGGKSGRPDRRPLKPAHNTVPGQGPLAADGFPLVRLQRLMADAGVAARRTCEAFITQGKVEVNGKLTMKLPIFVDPRHDKITVSGKLLAIARDGRKRVGGAGPVKPVYVMLHKPARVMTTTSDDGGRTTVMELIQIPGNPRIFPVGRLDFHASGMVLLTNDGDLANRLTHARYNVPRTYQLTLKGYASNEQLMNLARVIFPKSVKINPAWFGAAMVEQPVYAQPEPMNEQDADPRFAHRLVRKQQMRIAPLAPFDKTGKPLPTNLYESRDGMYIDPRDAGEPQPIGVNKVLVPTGEFVHDGPFRIIRRGSPTSANAGGRNRGGNRGGPRANSRDNSRGDSRGDPRDDSRSEHRSESRGSSSRMEPVRTGGPKTVVEFDLERPPFASLNDLVTSTGLELQYWSLVAMGGVKLTGVISGQWRMLLPQEVRLLKRSGTEPFKPSSGFTGPNQKLAGKTPVAGKGWGEAQTPGLGTLPKAQGGLGGAGSTGWQAAAADAARGSAGYVDPEYAPDEDADFDAEIDGDFDGELTGILGDEASENTEGAEHADADGETSSEIANIPTKAAAGQKSYLTDAHFESEDSDDEFEPDAEADGQDDEADDAAAAGKPAGKTGAKPAKPQPEAKPDKEYMPRTSSNPAPSGMPKPGSKGPRTIRPKF